MVAIVKARVTRGIDCTSWIGEERTAMTPNFQAQE